MSNKELPITVDPCVHGGDPCIRGQRLPVARLLAHLLWAEKEHRKEHPGHPYALCCGGLWDEALRTYCGDFTAVSQDAAGEALGFMLLALVRLALDCPETVLKKAIVKAIRRNQ